MLRSNANFEMPFTCNIFFRPLVETILRKIPLEMMERIRRRRGTTIETVDFGSDPPTEKTLIKLHRQVIRALQTHHRTETLWNDWTNKVFELEDVNRNMVRNEQENLIKLGQMIRSAKNIRKLFGIWFIIQRQNETNNRGGALIGSVLFRS